MESGFISPKLVGAIDAGTSSVRFLVFSPQTSRIVASHQITSKKICPKEGWVEQDPMMILESTIECLKKTSESLEALDISPNSIKAIGLSTQRETTVAWDKTTGKPLHNAIVWLDMRTTSTMEALLEKVPKKNNDNFRDICGLPMSPYFSALKMRWLLDEIPEVQQAFKEKKLLFGTVDSWLIWNLTGGPNGGVHMTDVTNASRTMLMNLRTLKWDQQMCNFFDVPIEILPTIKSSSEIYGKIVDAALEGTPISGCLGDQHSALLGQKCTQKGQAKCTFGTGCFLLYNTGNEIVKSKHGLLTTLGYQLGPKAKPCYALEGSVAVAGAAFGWLKDNMGLVEEVYFAENIARKVNHSRDVYFVPAFSGLYAPYWRPDARGVICGITEETSRSHIVRAAVDAICFQTKDILNAMHKDCGVPLSKLQVDGGMIKNELLMQTQADLCGVPVVRPHMAETSALGAAMAAGFAEGIDLWDLTAIEPSVCNTFSSKITETERQQRYFKWKMAIERSLGWDQYDQSVL